MPVIYLIAGENSGDVLGGRLMKALQTQAGETDLTFCGVGGESMTATGLNSLFPMSELSLMGIAEILPHIPRLLRRIRQTAEHIRQVRPDIVVTIDAPDFCFRVLRKLGKTDFPLVHYVAPTVWAWKPGRAAKIATFLDHILTLLPFEPPYFEAVGLPATYVGHSAVEDNPMGADGAAWRRSEGIGSEEKLLCLLPGSRHAEVSRLGADFFDVAATLWREGLIDRVVVPVAPSVREAVSELARNRECPVLLSHNPGQRYQVFAACTAALAASGTVSLELAMTGTPMVIGYRVAPITAWIVRRMILTDTAVLPNLITGERFIPEFIQNDCTLDNLLTALRPLMTDGTERQAQIEGFRRFASLMHLEGAAPSARAAGVVLDLLARQRNVGATST
ncbi:MAG: lipid-A-disaccharide synthase [Rhodospirillales bacterium]